MGMDLYIYNITQAKDKEDYYSIGRRPINIKGIECKCIEIPDQNFVSKCIEECLTKHNIPYNESHETYCYDFENGKSQVNMYTDDTIAKFKTLSKVIDDCYDNDSDKITREEAYNTYNDFGIEVAANSEYWKDSIQFNGIPLINTYRLMCDHDEVNYARKPFRSISDKNSKAYQMLMSNTKGDPDGSWVIFDKETEIDFRQLIRLIEDKDMIDHLNSMLPLKENQIIAIDW
ncbi:MAG: hypothetical protein DRH57_09290 [Candidatus Cloacimonadota bacterium]|nr:MAG: hypothetical protein DRH57_09290 [Candidatus Cloacimonadota bacterium]